MFCSFTKFQVLRHTLTKSNSQIVFERLEDLFLMPSML